MKYDRKFNSNEDTKEEQYTNYTNYFGASFMQEDSLEKDLNDFFSN